MTSSSSTSIGGGGGGNSNIYCLKWNHYQTSMTSGLAELLEDKEYSMTDITLSCEGQFIEAHKIVLVVSSPFFKEFFKANRIEKAGVTLIALANVKFKDLKNVLQFIYHGEVNVDRDDLNSFLQTGNLLKIKGLGEFSEVEETVQSSIMEMPMFGYSSAKSNFKGTTKGPVCATSSTSKSISQPPPVVFPPAEPSSRLSTAAVHIPNNSPQSIEPTNTSLSLSSLTTDFHNENDEIDEEMIDMDNVKPEPISVYSLVDSEDSDYDGGGITTAGELMANDDDSNSIKFGGQHSGSSVHSESLMIQTFAGDSSPSTSTLSQFSHLQNKSLQRKTRTADGEHGIGDECYDNSENPTLLFFCLCGTKFRSKQSLNRHIRETTAAKSIKLICPICRYKFSRERSLKFHLREGKCNKRLTGSDQTLG